MRRYIRLKSDHIKNQRGASMAIALLYFLVCAMVGSVVLAAASANVSHVKMEKRNEGNYLAVMSAAELLKAQLKDCAGEWEADYDEDEAADEEMRMGYKEGMLGCITDGSEGQEVKQALLGLFYQTYLNCLERDKLQVPRDQGGSERIQLTFKQAAGELTGDGDSSAYEVAPVMVTLTVTPDYAVLDSRNSQQLHVTADAKFSIADESSGQYLISLNMGALIHYTLDEEEDTEVDPDTGENNTTYRYSSQVIFSPDEPRLSGGWKTGGANK